MGTQQAIEAVRDAIVGSFKEMKTGKIKIA
jgi:hypothetical protein